MRKKKIRREERREGERGREEFLFLLPGFCEAASVFSLIRSRSPLDHVQILTAPSTYPDLHSVRSDCVFEVLSVGFWCQNRTCPGLFPAQTSFIIFDYRSIIRCPIGFIFGGGDEDTSIFILNGGFWFWTVGFRSVNSDIY